MKVPLIILFLISSISSFAQLTFDTTFSSGSVDLLLADFNWGDATIRSWDENNIRFRGSVSINLGENNEAFEWAVESEDGEIRVASDIPDFEELPEYITLYRDGEKIYSSPESADDAQWKAMRDEEHTWMSKGPVIEVEMELFVPKGLKIRVKSLYGDLNIENCSQAMEVENTYGHIVAEFQEDIPATGSSLTSTYSFVDAAVHEAMGMNLSLNTNHGSIYSNLDLEINLDESEQEGYHTVIVGKVNRGGKKLTLKSPYSNIYLRKLK